jgi:hypothetical protein
MYSVQGYGQLRCGAWRRAGKAPLKVLMQHLPGGIEDRIWCRSTHSWPWPTPQSRHHTQLNIDVHEFKLLNDFRQTIRQSDNQTISSLCLHAEKTHILREAYFWGHFQSMLLYIRRMLGYFRRILLYFRRMLRYFRRILGYFRMMLGYFWRMLGYFRRMLGYV